MWSKTSAWCGQLAFSVVSTSSSPTCTWLGPEFWSLPRCSPKCYLTSEWKSLIESLYPFSFAFSPAWLWCCGLITDGEVGFDLVFRVFFLNLSTILVQNLILWLQGCSLLAAVLFWAQFHLTGFLGACIEATSVIWQHSLQLLKATKM